MDNKLLCPQQIIKYLGAIQQLIEHRNLSKSYACLLPARFRDLFILLVEWRERAAGTVIVDGDEEGGDDNGGDLEASHAKSE